MIEQSSIIIMILSVAFAVVVPAGLCFYLTFSGKTTWRNILVGMAGYFVAELLLRSQVLGLLERSPAFAEIYSVPIYNGLIGGFTYAFFGAAVCYLAGFVLLKRPFDMKCALGMGVGIGSLHVIGTLGINSLMSLIVATNYNNGTLSSVAETLGTGYVAGILERFSAVTRLELVIDVFQYLAGIVPMIAVAVLLVYGLRARKHSFIFSAMAVWFFFEVFRIFLGYVSPWFSLLWVLFFGMLAWIFCELVKDIYKNTPEASYAPKTVRKKGNEKKDVSVVGDRRDKKKKKKKKK